MKRKSEQEEKVEKKSKINVDRKVLNLVCALMKKGQTTEAKQLIPLDARHLPLECCCTQDQTLLHHSVRTKNYEMIEYLLAGGANIDYMNNERYSVGSKNTPLFLAVELGDEKCCQFLIDRGADVNANNRVSDF